MLMEGGDIEADEARESDDTWLREGGRLREVGRLMSWSEGC